MKPKNMPAGTKKEAESQKKEIERKFLISNVPKNLASYPGHKILQGYLVISEDGTEIRLRKFGQKFFQTIKRGEGKIRKETEIAISKKQFEMMWAETEGKRIEKIRYIIPYQKRKIELDVYEGELAGLVVAEVEFLSKEESEKFIAPDWFGADVTDDKKYKNKNLATNKPEEKSLFKQSEKKKEVENKNREYPLEEGKNKIIDLIKEKIAKQDGNIIVQVAGGTSSGKTSAVAEAIKNSFGDDAIIISCDDYYRGKTFMNSEQEKGNNLNWDQPEALNLELFSSHLEQLKHGEEIEKPVYNMKESEPDSVEKILPKKIIIAEGLFVLGEQLRDKGDVKVFVDIGNHSRIIRKILRDIKRTGQNPKDILKYFFETIQPMHEKYIENTKQEADIIIRNEYIPRIESERSGLNEKQLKIKGELDPKIIHENGIEMMGSVKQIDKYYKVVSDGDESTEEILRIRDENGKKILTYKGPKKGDIFRERSKFEFYIDNEIEEELKKIYPEIVKTIEKERTFYQLEGMVFSEDKVVKIEGNKKTDLGRFVEIRSSGEIKSVEELKAVIEKLGLKVEDTIKESYFDM